MRPRHPWADSTPGNAGPTMLHHAERLSPQNVQVRGGKLNAGEVCVLAMILPVAGLLLSFPSE